MNPVKPSQATNGPTAEKSYAIVGKLCDFLQVNPYAAIKLPQYTSFSNISLTNLLELAVLQNHEGFSPTIDEYTNKLFRFCEINLWQYEIKLGLKGLGDTERKLFHQLLIHFFLHSYLLTEDMRYLNIALKLEKTSRISLLARIRLRNSIMPVLPLADINKELIEESIRTCQTTESE